MASPVHFPDAWTAEDQAIIEVLLFDAPPWTNKLKPAPPEALRRSAVDVSTAIRTAHWWRLVPPAVAAASLVNQSESVQQLMLRRSLQHREQTETRRKLKHREVQRRFMQRKKSQVARIKEEAARLEMEYDVLQLATEQKQLEESNAALRDEVGNKEPVPLPSRDQINALLEDQLELIRSHYEPLTTEQWDEMMARNLREMEAASAETGYESTGAVVLGWSDQRKVDYDAGCTKFVLAKTFLHLGAEGFRDTTWDKLKLEETHQQLFHPAVTIRTQIVQRVDDNGLVFHRVMFNPVTGGVVHAMEASMRVQYGRDFIIFQRTLEYNAAFECVPKSHNWMQLMTSLIYSPNRSGRAAATRRDDDAGCVFRYAGILRDLAPPDVRYWLTEMLWVILRFEGVMVSPIFSLRSD